MQIDANQCRCMENNAVSLSIMLEQIYKSTNRCKPRRHQGGTTEAPRRHKGGTKEATGDHGLRGGHRFRATKTFKAV